MTDEPHRAAEIGGEIRATAADVHHRLRQDGVRGDADAAAYAIARARESGVADTVCDEMATEVFQHILDKLGPPRRGRRFRFGRERDPQGALPSADERRLLPPGSDG